MQYWLRKFNLLIILISLSACVPMNVQPTRTAFTLEITPQATRLSPTKQAATATTAAATMSRCSQNGQTERYQIDSALLNGELFFSVYYPPCYSETKADGYTVLYALHGQNFTDAMWLDLGAEVVADKLVHNGSAAPFLIVMPYEEYYYRDEENNNFPLALLNEIIPWVEGSLNVCTEKPCRAIGGISRGASWAIRIGLAEWDFFGAIGAHSLPTFRGDREKLPDWLEEIPSGEEPRIYMDTGRFDPEVKTAARFEQVLNEKGVPHDWHLNEGRHNEAYWEENMEAYLLWYAEEWE